MDNHLQTVNIYNQHVREYVDSFMALELYKDTFDRFLELLPVNADILELGCGPGNVVKYLKEKRNDLNILGVDLAPEMIREAEKNNPDSKFVLMDIRRAGEIKEKFTAVITAFCLPYISYDDAAELFKNFCKLTSDEGMLYISCMEGPRDRSGFEKTSFTGDNELYINYYERSEIEKMLKESNFGIIEFSTKDYPEADGSTTTDLIYIGKKL